MPANSAEDRAVIPIRVDPKKFNRQCQLPYGLTVDVIESAMTEFVNFLSLINTQLHAKSMPRLETIIMSANFSSIVGEFMSAGIPKYAPTVVKNRYHNGHPDIIPAKTFPNDAVQHDHRGIEIKASRYLKGWQGHNAEKVFLMVFVFRSNRPGDSLKNVASVPFGFVEVLGAQLEKTDWLFAGRSPTSRRTITASVTGTGYQKMAANRIYRDPAMLPGAPTTPEPEFPAIIEELADQAEDV